MKKLRAKIRQAYYLLCYQYAHLYTHLSMNWRKYVKRIPFPYCYLWGRHDSPEPIRCKECGWGGMVRWLIHTYEWYGDDENGDVEPVDECPRCGGYL